MKYKLFLIVVLALFLVGCAQPINEVKSSDNVDSQVTVRGTVSNPIKIGELSGYTLTDDTGSIGIGSKSLPAEGSKVTVSGTLKKSLLLGYYIETKN